MKFIIAAFWVILAMKKNSFKLTETWKHSFTKIEKHQLKRDNHLTMEKQGWLPMGKIEADYKRRTWEVTR